MKAESLRRKWSAALADPWLGASLVWGFAEATLFFVVPDVIVGWIALRSPRRIVGPALVTSLGAMAGGLLVYQQASWFLSAFPHVPLISQALIDDVAHDVDARGWWALFAGPWSGLPYKVYAAEYGSRHAGALPLVLLTLPARLERLLPVAIGWALVGRWRWLASRPRLQGTCYIGFWVVVYAFYVMSMHSKYGGA